MFQKILSIFLKSPFKVLLKAERSVGHLEKLRFLCGPSSTRLNLFSINLILLVQGCFDKHWGFRCLKEPLIV